MSDLAADLRSAALRWPMQEARLVRLVADRRCPPRLMRKLAAALLEGTSNFTGDLARLIRAAPGGDLRAHLLDNLLEESGLQVVPGVGVQFDAEQVHTTWARRFARACGMDDEGLRALDSGGARNGTRGFDQVFEEHGWLGAASYLLAQEANTPQTLKPMLEGLLELGFEPDALILFSAHIEADERHGGDALELLAREIESGASREVVLGCVERGARDWWQLHN